MKEHWAMGAALMRPIVGTVGDRRSANLAGMDPVSVTNPPLLELAASIARSHHEKWDGTGYPAGLQGEAIPTECRITYVGDVCVALCSTRPYKTGYPLKQCIEIMTSERGTRFDPKILDAFLANINQIQTIQNQHPDV